jgi:MarR family transcriptional regulator, multiple gene regulator MgrA
MYGIHRAINQKKFKSESHKSIVSIMYIANFIKNYHSSQFKKHKLTPQQYNILRILRGSHPKPLTVGILKERMLDKMSDASRLVDRLEKQNLAKRNLNHVDRRAMDVSITEQGLSILSLIDLEEESFNSIINALSTEEIENLNSILDKLIDLHLPVSEDNA